MTKKHPSSPNEPEQCWLDFARKHKGQGGFEQVESRYNFNGNKWVIKRENEFEVTFTWNTLRPSSTSGVQVRTDFIFPFKNGENMKFKIYKNDFLTKVFLLFDSWKIKIGDKELDSKYIFITNRPQYLQSIAVDLKKIETENVGTDFIMEIQGSEIGIEENRLLIQVNELLKEAEIIEAFFNLGATLRGKINKGY